MIIYLFVSTCLPWSLYVFQLTVKHPLLSVLLVQIWFQLGFTGSPWLTLSVTTEGNRNPKLDEFGNCVVGDWLEDSWKSSSRPFRDCWLVDRYLRNYCGSLRPPFVPGTTNTKVGYRLVTDPEEFSSRLETNISSEAIPSFGVVGRTMAGYGHQLCSTIDHRTKPNSCFMVPSSRSIGHVYIARARDRVCSVREQMFGRSLVKAKDVGRTIQSEAATGSLIQQRR